jgi:hypothetical protein
MPGERDDHAHGKATVREFDGAARVLLQLRSGIWPAKAEEDLKMW